MKAVLSNRIYLDSLSPENIGVLTTVLKYTLTKMVGSVKHVETINNFRRVSETICSIPSGREDLIPEGYEIIDKRVTKPVTFPRFNGTLRPAQQEIYDKLEGSCLLNAPVSWGKTFAALAMAAKLGQKTLIVTHTTMLRDQWVAEIEKVFGIEAGIVGSGKWNIDPIIVVGNVQSLTRKMELLAGEFGTVILDEVHHVAASTFSSIIDKCKAKYKIGLSGTLIRKDGKHVFFTDYFGFETFRPEKENCMIPRVVVVESQIHLKAGAHWANRVTELEVYNETYKHMVVDLATNAASKGYKVLVVASRVEFLKWAAENTPRSDSITGGIKSIEERTSILNRISSGEIDILYGTMSIFSEGISQNDLSCIILATPINNESLLTQLIGRIVREVEGKKQPLIIDINLKGPSTKSQSDSRLSHYLKAGYQVQILKK